MEKDVRKNGTQGVCAGSQEELLLSWKVIGILGMTSFVFFTWCFRLGACGADRYKSCVSCPEMGS